MRLRLVTLIGLGLFGLGGAIGASFYLFSWFASSSLRSFAPNSPRFPTPAEGVVFFLYIILVVAWVYGGFELMIVGAVLTIVGVISDLVKSRDQQSRSVSSKNAP